MIRANLSDAAANLPDLVDAAVRGEEVLITADEAGGARTVRLVAIIPRTRRAQFGSARGLIEIAEDFDAPLEDFAGYQ